jgi:hypothetical protein
MPKCAIRGKPKYPERNIAEMVIEDRQCKRLFMEWDRSLDVMKIEE